MATLNELVAYINCPLKQYYMTKDKEQVLDIKQIKAVVLAHVIKYMFTRLGLRKNITLEHLKKQLGLAWNEMKATYCMSYDYKDLIEILNKLHKIPSIVKEHDEVLAIDYPTVYTMYGGVTVGSSADFIILHNSHRPKNSSLSIVLLDMNHHKTSSSELMLRSGVTLASMKADMKYLKTPIEISFLKCMTGILTKTYLDYKDLRKVEEMVKNVSLGIERKVYYPRPDKTQCDSCTYSTICPWV